jgi:hypothetical protein
MTTDLVARLRYTAARSRHAWRHRQKGGPRLVVFSMAKTGSSSVVAALRAAGLGPVHHVHDLDPAFLEREEAEYRWTGRPWRNWDAQRLLRTPPTADAPWHVITLVREPLAQTVSAFLQPGVRRGYLHAGVTVDELVERFGDRFDRLPLHWFESHLEPTLGLDVYSTTFEPSRGYTVVDSPSVRLLVLRCEDLGAAPAGITELLDRSVDVTVPRLNVGADKDYAGIYDELRAALRPTDEQLQRAYGSRLVRHFYSPVEIDRFRALWTNPGDHEA